MTANTWWATGRPDGTEAAARPTSFARRRFPPSDGKTLCNLYNELGAAH